MIGLKNMRYYPLIFILGLFVFTKSIKVPKKPKDGQKPKDEKLEKVEKMEKIEEKEKKVE